MGKDMMSTSLMSNRISFLNTLDIFFLLYNSTHGEGTTQELLLLLNRTLKTKTQDSSCFGLFFSEKHSFEIPRLERKKGQHTSDLSITHINSVFNVSTLTQGYKIYTRKQHRNLALCPQVILASSCQPHIYMWRAIQSTPHVFHSNFFIIIIIKRRMGERVYSCLLSHVEEMQFSLHNSVNGAQS